MQKEYVKVVEGAYRVGNTRVSLDSLVYLFREGMSAESMVESYPALTLEQVHGALAFSTWQTKTRLTRISRKGTARLNRSTRDRGKEMRN
jgi:uncharacterized protein (DUF433 family)